MRFKAIDADDLAPVANIVPETEVILANIPLGFDGSHSFDPEYDAITYQWDFGDGTTSTAVSPTHTYASADQQRVVTLTVSDGQKTDSATVTMRVCPQPTGATPGVVALQADGPLEFGAVAPGASVTRTFHVTNASTDPSSVLATCLGFDRPSPAFLVSPPQLALHAQEGADVTVTFAPNPEGHATATIHLASPAGNQPLVSLLAHGYGGSAPGAGPTMASSPVFYGTPPGLDLAVRGFLPDGMPITPDTAVHVCSGGNSTGDLCVSDAQCSANGGTCP